MRASLARAATRPEDFVLASDVATKSDEQQQARNERDAARDQQEKLSLLQDVLQVGVNQAATKLSSFFDALVQSDGNADRPYMSIVIPAYQEIVQDIIWPEDVPPAARETLAKYESVERLQELFPTLKIQSSERNFLPEYLEEIVAIAEREFPQRKIEVIVVANGKKAKIDNTISDSEAIYEAAYSRNPALRGLFRVIDRKYGGKPGAVGQGVEEARGEYILYADADGATPSTMVDRFFDVLAEAEAEGSQIDILAGSRYDHWLSLGEEVEARPISRDVPSRALNLLLARPLSGQWRMADTQAGFKAGRSDVIQAAFSSGLIPGVDFEGEIPSGWFNDVALIRIIKDLPASIMGRKANIVEVPIEWAEKGDSRIDPRRVFKELPSDAAQILRGIISSDYSKFWQEDFEHTQQMLPLRQTRVLVSNERGSLVRGYAPDDTLVYRLIPTQELGIDTIGEFQDWLDQYISTEAGVQQVFQLDSAYMGPPY